MGKKKKKLPNKHKKNRVMLGNLDCFGVIDKGKISLPRVPVAFDDNRLDMGGKW